ncbi:hypothetical protein [Achromobacter marplatensis]|uniref:hypothetical protein n=1 Tax=Achromobacter marplatensis TaxID=470868 RepID=UPI0039F69AED
MTAPVFEVGIIHLYVGQAVFVAAGHPLAALAEVTRSDLARCRQLVMQREGVGDVVLSPAVWRTGSFYSIAGMGQLLGEPGVA